MQQLTSQEPFEQEQELFDPWKDVDSVRAVDVARVAGVTRNEVRHVTLAGLITPQERKAGSRAPVRFAKDDALFLFYAARMAQAIGQALVAIVRMLLAARATLASDGGFMLPPPQTMFTDSPKTP